MSRAYKTEAIILKRSNLGEADRILTAYTKHYGKIKTLAKGVRKLTSRKGGNVESFNHVSLFLAKGKNLDIVTEAVVINSFKSWRKNLLGVGLAFYFCELVDKLTPEEQVHQDVFDLLKESLGKIGQVKPAGFVRDFEERLLDYLGFGVPTEIKEPPGSLKNYIETITERKINSPKILRDLG